jgi:Spy/CpxP family protein refolding chaperone
MKINRLISTLALLAPLSAFAQGGPGGPPEDGRPPMHGPMMAHEMGKWWQDSEVAKKLQLTDAQSKQLNQIFYDHRMKLIDFGADMEKQDLKLQTLLDEDVPDTAQVGSQVDQVLNARGKLEREFTMMNLDLRKVLSVEQWRQLKSIHQQHGPPHHPFPPGVGPDGHGPMGQNDMPQAPPPPGPGDN